MISTMFKQFDNLFTMMQVLNTEEACINHFRAARWPNGVVCPHCGAVKVYNLNNQTHKCAECKIKFSIRHNTIFTDSKISLQKWFMAIYLITSHKKGISSCQLARDIKVTQKTAWFMLHRIRNATDAPESSEMLNGTVEVDETYVGGKEKNKHQHKRTKGTQGAGSHKTKTVIFGMVKRNGELRLKKIPRTDSATVAPIILSNVCPTSIVNTDEASAYNWVKGSYKHDVVAHNAGEYVRGESYTNTIEGVFSHFKRAILGTYHHVSKKHIDRYARMFSYRWNSRTMGEGQRLNMLLTKTVGRRLKYDQLIGKIA